MVALAGAALSLAAPSRAAEPLVVAVGASLWWYPGCAGDAAACTDPARTLSYADDDVWRASYLLASSLDPNAYRILVSPDEETRGREFPSPPAGSATAAGLVEALAALRGAAAGPRDVVVYLAAHGSATEIHLDDGRHEFAALRREIERLLGPDDRLLLVADVCWSGSWRGVDDFPVTDDAAAFPAVQRSASTAAEAVVDGRTPEDAVLGGGVFSYLVLSGLMGAADADGDGGVGALELSDFVHGYVATDRRFSPAIRVPDADPEAVFSVPRAQTGIQLGPETGSARWLVLHRDGTLLVEAFLREGDERLLHVPSGPYRTLRIPVVRMDGAYRASSSRATAWEIVVGSGVPAAPSGSGEEVLLDRRTLSRDGLLAEVVLPGMAVATPPSNAARYHDSARGTLFAGVAAQTLLDLGAVAGPAFRYSRNLGAARARLFTGLSLGTRAGTDPWPALVALDPIGFEFDVVHGQTAALSIGSAVHLVAVRLRWQDVTAGTVGGGAALGLAASWWPTHRWAVRAGADWLPTAWMRARNEPGPTGVTHRVGWLGDPSRFRAGVAVQWNL